VSIEKKPGPYFQASRGEENASRVDPLNHGLSVTVMATTVEGTTAALYAASGLAKDLNARITLLKMEVAQTHTGVDKPAEVPDFAMRERPSLVFRSAATEEEVAFRICRCHDRDNGLLRALRRRALVVIGGKRKWWLSGEERLEYALRRLGHQVIFIDIGRKKTCSSMVGLSGQHPSSSTIPEENMLVEYLSFGCEDSL
jgi:hypothetical protein